MQQRLSFLIDDSKQQYFLRLPQKSNIIQKSIKARWTLLKNFLINSKITVIPPLFQNNKFSTDFKKKAQFLIPFSQSSAT